MESKQGMTPEQMLDQMGYEQRSSGAWWPKHGGGPSVDVVKAMRAYRAQGESVRPSLIPASNPASSISGRDNLLKEYEASGETGSLSFCGWLVKQVMERRASSIPQTDENICPGCYNSYDHCDCGAPPYDFGCEHAMRNAMGADIQCDCANKLGEPARPLPSKDQSPAEAGDGLSLPDSIPQSKAEVPK